MRRSATVLLLLAALSACQKPNVPVQQDDYDRTGPVQPDPAPGSSVADIRAAQKPETPRPPALAFVGTGDTTLRTYSSVLRDLDTGCEYLATTLYQNDVQIVPRMVPSPGAPGGTVQRCVARREGGGYAWIGDELQVRVSTMRDLRTGCEYIAGTMFEDGSFLIPRMIRSGDGPTVQICHPAADHPGSEG